MEKEKPKKEKKAPVEDSLPSMEIVPFKNWMILLACAVLVVIFLGWSIFGSVSTWSTGKGIILPGSAKIFTASLINDDVVTQVLVRPGDKVKKNQTIAITASEKLSQQLKQQENYLQKLTQRKDKLVEKFSDQTELLKQYYSELNAALKQQYKNSKLYNDYLKALLKDVKKLQKRGYVSIVDLDNYQKKFFESLSAINSALDKMLKSHYTKSNDYLNIFKELNTESLKIIQQENKYKNLKIEYEQSKYIKSPIDGEVIALTSSAGNYLPKGTPIVNIVEISDHYSLFALFSPALGKQLKPDMKAFISPTYVNKYRYGSIVGKVSQINEYPASENAMLAVIDNENILYQLGFNKDSMMMVNIALPGDAKAVSGFKWTSENGPPFRVTPGSICTVNIATREQAPITLAIPLLRKWLNLGS